ncbi:MAG: hypothetical protein ACJA0M_001942 [Chitinophagales bacterium]
MARLNKPWLHFLVLGIVLYKLQGAMFPEPKTVIGPLEETRLEALQLQWFTRVGQQPSPSQKIKMITDELDRDLLFQRALDLELHLYDKTVYQQLIRDMRFLGMAEEKTEDELFQQAVAMRLHLGDEVVKRRLIQEMQRRLLFANPAVMPTKAQVLAEFSARKNQFRLPARYSIEHIFFNLDREAEVQSVIATIQQQQIDAGSAKRFSSPFMSGYKFHQQTPDQLVRLFGVQFVSTLINAGPIVGQPIGPIRSIYGMHYVWVTAIEPGRDAQLEEVEPQVRRDLEAKASKLALKNSITELRSKYEVIL